MSSYASLLASRQPDDRAWGLSDMYQHGYGHGSICNSCGTIKNTLKRLDRFGERWLLAWCPTCYDFKVRPQIIAGILREEGPAAAAAWVQRSDREAAMVREMKARWEEDFVRRYAEMQEIIALPPPRPYAWYEQGEHGLCRACGRDPYDCRCEEDHEDESPYDEGPPDEGGYDDYNEDEDASCGCGACEEHDPSHAGYEGF